MLCGPETVMFVMAVERTSKKDIVSRGSIVNNKRFIIYIYIYKCQKEG